MLGELAVSFCERKVGEPSLCLDLWSFPDGTCNLVVSTSLGHAELEVAFPCVPGQLEAVTRGKALNLENQDGLMWVEQCAELVCAEYTSRKSNLHYRQCIAVQEYQQAVNLLVEGAIGYIA